MKSWNLGPFTRPVDQPVLTPMKELVFDCPMQKKPVHWAENHMFNHVTIMKDGKVHILFWVVESEGDEERVFMDGPTSHQGNVAILHT